MYLDKEKKIISLIKKYLFSSHIKTGIVFSLVTIGIMLYAAPMDIPHVFKYGEIVSSSKINANFKALQDEINALKNQIGGAPAGTVVPFAGDTIPDGWLACDGTQLDPADPQYSDLFNAIGTLWGGDGNNTFHLPDLRGLFLRGVNAGRNDDYSDPDNANRKDRLGGTIGDRVGSYQDDEIVAHSHNVNIKTKYISHVLWNRNGYIMSNSAFGADHAGTEGETFSPNSQNSGGNETRPKNAAVHYIIKY